MDNNEFKLCKGCGKKIKASARFCNGCGMECPPDQVPQSDKEKSGKAEKSIKCPVCGADLKLGAKFCNKCGASLAETDSEVIIKMEPEQQQPAQPKSKTGSKRKSFRIIAAVLAENKGTCHLGAMSR